PGLSTWDTKLNAPCRTPGSKEQLQLLWISISPDACAGVAKPALAATSATRPVRRRDVPCMGKNYRSAQDLEGGRAGGVGDANVVEALGVVADAGEDGVGLGHAVAEEPAHDRPEARDDLEHVGLEEVLRDHAGQVAAGVQVPGDRAPDVPGG